MANCVAFFAVWLPFVRMCDTHHHHGHAKQYAHLGIAMPTVLVMLLMSSGLVLTAWRNVWLHELLLQARADAVRTQWVADATLLSALDDVLERHVAVGENSSIDASTAQRHNMGSLEQNHVFFPKTTDELATLRERLGTNACREGICAPMQPLPSIASYWQNMASSCMPVAAESNPVPNKNACYWVEIFLLTDTIHVNTLIYRITAMASGWKSAQPTVLQAVWQPNDNTADTSNNAPQGRWTSWAVLHAP